jgi:hypothetical protein
VPDTRYTETPLYGSRDDKNFLKLAKEWILDCSRQHQSCGKLETDGSFTPNRLIYVGTVKRPTICLIERFSPLNTQGLSYFPLSHCWGEEVGLKLLKANYDAMKEGIAAEVLPLNFRHAIQITRDLDVGYIWIDSLCIIQDSPDDWARESVLITNIALTSLIHSTHISKL